MPHGRHTNWNNAKEVAPKVSGRAMRVFEHACEIS